MKKGEDGFTRSTPVEVQDYPFQVLGPCTPDGKPLTSTVDSEQTTERKRGRPAKEQATTTDLPPLASP
jgi:hypothetical protein